MKVGEVSQTVEVTASAPLLQTDTTLLGNILDTKAVKEIAAFHAQYQPAYLGRGAWSCDTQPVWLSGSTEYVRHGAAICEWRPRAGEQLHSGWHGQ